MKTIAKTKIVRVVGGEAYYAKIQIDNEIRWEEFYKDLSAIIPQYRDKTFKTTNCLSQSPNPGLIHKLIRPLPSNYETDLLTPYQKNQYAEGHQPLPPLRLR